MTSQTRISSSRQYTSFHKTGFYQDDNIHEDQQYMSAVLLRLAAHHSINPLSVGGALKTYWKPLEVWHTRDNASYFAMAQLFIVLFDKIGAAMLKKKEKSVDGLKGSVPTDFDRSGPNFGPIVNLGFLTIRAVEMTSSTGQNYNSTDFDRSGPNFGPIVNLGFLAIRAVEMTSPKGQEGQL